MTLSQLNPSIPFMEELISTQQMNRTAQGSSTASNSSLCTTTKGVTQLSQQQLEKFPYIKQYFLAHRNGGINSLDWSHNEQYIVTCGNDKTVRLFDVQQMKTLKIMHGHINLVFAVKFSPMGNLIASASFDETVKIWSSLTGECLRTLSAHTDPVTSVDFAHDGTIVMSSGFDGHVRLWDTSTGQCLKSHVSSQLLRNPPVACARFSPNSQFSMGLLFDGAVRLWKNDTSSQIMNQSNAVGTGGAIRVYTGAHRIQGKYCTNLEWFLPEDGSTYIAVPSEPKVDSTFYEHRRKDDSSQEIPTQPAIVLYDVQTKKIIQQATTPDHQNVITSISTREGAVCSCDLDGNVVIWKWTRKEEE